MGAKLQNILNETETQGRRAHREMLRRRAARYVRDGRHLEFWTFPANRAAVTAALHAPHDPAATRALCRALYRDWKTALALPRHIVGRAMRVDELRILLACECRLYRLQSASIDAQKGMVSFLNALADPAE